jgi:lipoprotein NlpI
MREIIAYYRGEGTPAEILAAAEAGDDAGRRNRLCYAHLYLGLFAEATGDMEAAKQHIRLAAGRYAMDHYMGRTAQVHATLRGWEPAE